MGLKIKDVTLFIYTYNVLMFCILFFFFVPFFFETHDRKSPTDKYSTSVEFPSRPTLFFSRKNRMKFVFCFFFCSTLPPSMVFFKDGERGEMREMLCIDRRQLAKGPTQRRERKRGEERIQLQLCKCPDVPPLFSTHWIG